MIGSLSDRYRNSIAILTMSPHSRRQSRLSSSADPPDRPRRSANTTLSKRTWLLLAFVPILGPIISFIILRSIRELLLSDRVILNDTLTGGLRDRPAKDVVGNSMFDMSFCYYGLYVQPWEDVSRDCKGNFRPPDFYHDREVPYKYEICWPKGESAPILTPQLLFAVQQIILFSGVLLCMVYQFKRLKTMLESRTERFVFVPSKKRDIMNSVTLCVGLFACLAFFLVACFPSNTDYIWDRHWSAKTHSNCALAGIFSLVLYMLLHVGVSWPFTKWPVRLYMVTVAFAILFLWKNYQRGPTGCSYPKKYEYNTLCAWLAILCKALYFLPYVVWFVGESGHLKNFTLWVMPLLAGLAALVLSGISSSYCTVRYLRDARDPLPDVVFELLDYHMCPVLKNLIECMVNVVISGTILVLALNRNVEIWTRHWYSFAIFYFGKAVCQVVTFLPYSGGQEAALEICQLETNPDSLTCKDMMTFSSPGRQCGAMMYSGHCGSIIICLWSLLRLLKRRGCTKATRAWVGCLGYIYSTAHSTMMIAHRTHYTVDILVAMVVSHLIVNSKLLREWSYSDSEDDQGTATNSEAREMGDQTTSLEIHQSSDEEESIHLLVTL